jgi:thioredoxin reductase (NADPH)
MVDSEVRELQGDQALEAITVVSSPTGTRRVLPARALFVFIGAVPCTGWLGGLVDLDDHGFVRTGAGALAAAGGPEGTGPLPLETNRPGVFAVGDVRSGSAKRVAAAVGEGAMAIRLAFEEPGRHRPPRQGGTHMTTTALAGASARHEGARDVRRQRCQ